MIRFGIIIFFLVSMMIVPTQAEDNRPTGFRLDYGSSKPMNLPMVGDIPSLLVDFDYSESQIPNVFSTDLNEDKFDDYLVQAAPSLCGTGGCPYALINGETKKRIGDFFGSPILILDKKINGFPVVQSFGHLNVESGMFTTYVFDGQKYQKVSDVEISGSSLEKLDFEQFRKVK